MSNENLTKAILLDGRVLIEQADGSFRPAAIQTDWERVDNLSDEEIERMAAEDAAEDIPHSVWTDIEPIETEKSPVFMKLDADVLAWFRNQGRGYQTRINHVLRHYVDAQKA